LCLGSLALTTPATAQSPDPATVVILFDGSGSMWGKLAGDNRAKFEIARETIRQTIPRLSSNTRAGLITFGHRRRSECNDIEVMSPPETIDADRLVAPLDRLNPKGRGPIADALREAAKIARTVPGPKTIVLIHDDPDNCQQDPCAAAAEIKASSPGLVVQVVSIAMRKEDTQRLACVAALTGGKQYEPQTGPALITAIEDALLAQTAARPVAAQMRGAPALAVRPKAPAAGPPGLQLTAALSAQGALVTEPVRWSVYRDAAGDTEAVGQALAAAPDFPLPPGKYVVEARLGLASARQPVEIAASHPTVATITLNAGAIRLATALSKGGRLLPNAMVTIEEQAANADARARPVWMGLADSSDLVLPAGIYRVTVQQGRARIQRQVIVPAGGRADPDLALSAAMLTLTSRAAQETTARADVLFLVHEEDPTAPQGRREIARSTAHPAIFTLPTGTYYVTARSADTDVQERLVLRPGDEVSRNVQMGSASVWLEAKLQGDSGSLADPVIYRVQRIDRDAQEAPRQPVAGGRLNLAPGRYRIEAQLVGSNASAGREIDVRASAEQRITIEFPAAKVRFRLADTAAAPSDVLWDVADVSRKTVWRTLSPEPQTYLAPGRYTVRVENRERSFTRTIEVRAGEARTFEFSATPQ
jgi:Ca-activated chloride channel family protein